jgi:P27 family predicted phage terminase small subunit
VGLRGRVPKPTAIRIFEGNPGRRPINAFEPKPRPIAPKCPEHIKSDPVAYETWRSYLAILKRMRVLTEADGLILANLCLAHSHLMVNLGKMRDLNAQGKSGIAGMIVQTKTGYLALNQIYANVTACMEQELRYCRELGLSPSARSRLQISEEEPQDGDGVLNGQWRPSG